MILKRLPLAALLCLATAANAAHDKGKKAAADKVSVSFYFSVRNADQLASFIDATTTPGNPQFRRFLSTEQFARRYGASDRDIDDLVHSLKSAGIKVTDIYPDNLVLTALGTTDQWNKFFGLTLHDFSDGARTFFKPDHAPAPLSGIAGVRGLDTEHLLSHRHVNAHAGRNQPPVLPQNGTATGVPGSFTVGDVAQQYQVDPLYRAGLNGRGVTLGIATLADFDIRDAEQYWKGIGLDTRKGRIHKIHVDGGGGKGVDFGSDETTLDVQQSGGLAPQADILVYDAPNTDQGFNDLFYRVASDNEVDSYSVSWGQSEIFSLANDGGEGLLILDQAFMEAAAQGISVFAASGDDGAYDTTSALGPGFLPVLSIDSPSSDPYVLASGGTTAPWSGTFSDGETITVAKERVWGWDYLEQLYANFGYDAFSVGGGGGVSSFFGAPSWQRHTDGIRRTEAGQSVVDVDGNDYLDLPAGYAGRNSPDLSLNADPYSGFLIYYPPYEDDASGFASGWGGTSFVAPQLNGITAVIGQLTGRLGALGPQAYRLRKSANAFNDIKDGNNWFYNGVKGYDPGAGLGTINAANLAVGLWLQGF